MSDDPLTHVFLLFLQVMPQDEVISYEAFKAKIDEKEHDEGFRSMVKDFVHDQHEHEDLCNMSVNCICSNEHLACLARAIFRELLK